MPDAEKKFELERDLRRTPPGAGFFVLDQRSSPVDEKVSDFFTHAKLASAYVIEIPSSLIMARIMHGF